MRVHTHKKSGGGRQGQRPTEVAFVTIDIDNQIPQDKLLETIEVGIKDKD
jgi:hypothetical protein